MLRPLRSLRTLPSLPFLLAVLLSGALLGAACGGGSDIDLTGVNAAELLQRAADRTGQEQRFHFVLEHQNGATEIVRGLQMTRAEGDVDGAERLSIEVEAEAGPLNIDVSIVIIGADAWITNPLTGRWEREEISVSDVFDPTSGVIPIVRGATEPAVTRVDRIDGIDSYRVDATIDSGVLTVFSSDAEPGRPIAATAWVGVDDPLVYRVEVTGAVTRSEDDDLVRRLTLSRFAEDVDIRPPR